MSIMGSDNIEDFQKRPEGKAEEDYFSQGADIASGLYLVATPIGNLRDITLRALDVLRGADIVMCEDTRVTRKLLNFYQIKAKLISCNDHNEGERCAQILSFLSEGKVVALVSDAGMPLVSDPGYRVVRTCMDAGHYVTSVPGANAPLAALQLSGLPSDAFCFIGFLPSKKKARCDALMKWKDIPASLIVFESARRLTDSLTDIENVLGGRRVSVVREITKLYEEVRCDVPAELVSYYEEHGAPKGEIVLVIEPAAEVELSNSDVEVMLVEAMRDMRVKDAAAHVAEKTGRKKSDLYDQALRLKD